MLLSWHGRVLISAFATRYICVLCAPCGVHTKYVALGARMWCTQIYVSNICVCVCE